jgi:exodeoxyribonuclease III
MKLATWNVNSLTVRLPQVIDWLKAQEALGPEQAIDVLALQELKMTDDKFPLAAFNEAGYHAQWFGQKTYKRCGAHFALRRDTGRQKYSWF